MDKDAMIQAAEEEWLAWYNDPILNRVGFEEMTWHWFWLILAESIWPSPSIETTEHYIALLDAENGG